MFHTGFICRIEKVDGNITNKTHLLYFKIPKGDFLSEHHTFRERQCLYTTLECSVGLPHQEARRHRLSHLMGPFFLEVNKKLLYEHVESHAMFLLTLFVISVIKGILNVKCIV